MALFGQACSVLCWTLAGALARYPRTDGLGKKARGPLPVPDLRHAGCSLAGSVLDSVQGGRWAHAPLGGRAWLYGDPPTHPSGLHLLGLRSLNCLRLAPGADSVVMSPSVSGQWPASRQRVSPIRSLSTPCSRSLLESLIFYPQPIGNHYSLLTTTARTLPRKHTLTGHPRVLCLSRSPPIYPPH